MNLYDYLQKTTDWEITVWDNDYDVETYFYKTDEKDDWNKAMNKLAKLLTVSEISKNGITVNLSEVIEKKIPQLKEAELFIRCDIDAIMDGINAILAGNVSERWLTEFVEILRRD